MKNPLDISYCPSYSSDEDYAEQDEARENTTTRTAYHRARSDRKSGVKAGQTYARVYQRTWWIDDDGNHEGYATTREWVVAESLYLRNKTNPVNVTP